MDIDDRRRELNPGSSQKRTCVVAEVETCIERVASRIYRGGHGVPPAVIQRTYATGCGTPRAPYGSSPSVEGSQVSDSKVLTSADPSQLARACQPSYSRLTMMTRLSTKGQLIIPRAIRARRGWRPGAELVIDERGDQVILRLAAEPAESRLEDLIGCTGYRGRRRSLRQMDAGIAKGARRR